MTLPTNEEGLRQLLSDANAALYSLLQQKENEAEAARTAIEAAKTTLETLLGPVEAVPGQGSIRAVLAYGDPVIKQNAADAVPLIVHGMETLTATMIEITKLVSAIND